MFYELPDEIINLIYEFDSTFKNEFNSVLYDLQLVRFLKNNIIYCIYDPKRQCIHLTNNIEKPNYICTSCGINYIKYLKIVKEYNLKEFDISSFNFNSFYVYSSIEI